MKIVEARSLNGRGQCCGRKPSVYRRPAPHLFCTRCDAAFDPDTGKQIPNWAYYKLDDVRFDCRTTAFPPPDRGSA